VKKPNPSQNQTAPKIVTSTTSHAANPVVTKRAQTQSAVVVGAKTNDGAGRNEMGKNNGNTPASIDHNAQSQSIQRKPDDAVSTVVTKAAAVTTTKTKSKPMATNVNQKMPPLSSTTTPVQQHKAPNAVPLQIPKAEPKVNRMAKLSVDKCWKMDMTEKLSEQELALFIQKTDLFVQNATNELRSECRWNGVRYTDPLTMADRGMDLDIGAEFEWIKKVSMERDVSWDDSSSLNLFERVVSDLAY